MKRIGVLYHPLKKDACVLARQAAHFLRERQLAVWLCSAWEWERARPQIEGTDMVLSVGGDGTILRSAQAVVPRAIPLVGINLGRLGFMTELTVAESMEKLAALLAGEGHVDERSLLRAELEPNGGGQARQFYALNDVVMARGGTARLINIEASIDGEPMTTYRADGVVMATATGCTGYALAAGGPILHPQAQDFVLVPILSHLGYAYPMVLPSTSTARLALARPTPGILSIDGHINIDLACGDVVTVKHSPDVVRFLRVHNEPFYGSLEQRLKGKQPENASTES